MAPKPVMMKNVDLILGDEAQGSNFKCQLTSVKLTPSPQIQKLKTLCPDGRFADVDDPEWDLELGYVYGRKAGAGTTPADVVLADYLLDHAGQKVPFTFAPVSGGTRYSGEVTVVPGEIGGKQGSWAESTVTLPVEGQPKRTEPAGA